MAVKFTNWRTAGPGTPQPRNIDGRPDTFHHPFGLLCDADQIPLSHYWQGYGPITDEGQLLLHLHEF